ncbi:MAG: hypothetical protein PVJ55_10800 [Anaerolineae bacterium]|jgi:uridine phosphorylase
MAYLITPEQTLTAALRMGTNRDGLGLPGIAVLTFSRGVMERLDELCGFEDLAWISAPDHPYGAARIVRRGQIGGLGVTGLVPPMGASALACVVEDLAACGVQAVFLVCAAWSLGAPVRFGDLIVPSVSFGLDGTSVHYGNAEGEVRAAPRVVEALSEACRVHGAQVHVGANATCEALYRITPEMADDYRRRGCVCMENGEVSTLLAVTSALGVLGGALLQPYIDLTDGWDADRLESPRYKDACRLQVEAVLAASLRLWREHLI